MLQTVNKDMDDSNIFKLWNKKKKANLECYAKQSYV